MDKRAISNPDGSDSKIWLGGAAILPLLIILLAIALHARSLTWGFLYDDFMHQASLRYGSGEISRSPWELYNYGGRTEPGDALYKRGLLPWWTSSDFRIRFFRPVTSLSIWLDYQVFGDWAPGYHATSLALYAGFLTLAFVLFRSLGVSPGAACWALAVLAFEDSHVMPVGWIANRDALLASLFIVLSIWSVQRYCRSRTRRWLALALVSFLMACGSKESGLVGLPLVGFYLLIVDRPSPEENLWQSSLRVLRNSTFWLFLLVACAWLAFYVSTGQGSKDGLYIIPWQEPVTYAMRLARLVPMAFACLVFNLPIDLVFVRPDLLGPIVTVSVLLTGVLVILFWRHLRANRLALFAAGWVIIALAPLGGAEISDRHLMSAAVGSSLLVGLLLGELGPLSEMIRHRRLGRLAIVAFFLFSAVLFSMPSTVIRARLVAETGTKDREAIASAQIEPGQGERAVFVLTTPSALLTLTMATTWAVLHSDTKGYPTFMQMGRRPIKWRRESEDTAVLDYGPPTLLTHRYEKMFHTKKKSPAPGTTYIAPEFTATVLASEPAGIGSVRLRFNRSLDDPAYQFLVWENGKLRRVTAPAVGQTVAMPPAEPMTPFAP